MEYSIADAAGRQQRNNRLRGTGHLSRYNAIDAHGIYLVQLTDWMADRWNRLTTASPQDQQKTYEDMAGLPMTGRPH